MDLGSDFVITGIATQGFQTMNSDYFVKEYKVAYSKDGKIWKFLPVSINLILCEIRNNNDCDNYKIIINSDFLFIYFIYFF